MQTGSTPPLVYGIPNCDTVKKARAWLAAQGIEHQFHDFRKQGVPTDLLPAWCEALGWEALVNRRGTTWRKLDAAAQLAVQDAASACALMAREPSVIKRPVVQWPGGHLSLGFDAQEWQRRAQA